MKPYFGRGIHPLLLPLIPENIHPLLLPLYSGSCYNIHPLLQPLSAGNSFPSLITPPPNHDTLLEDPVVCATTNLHPSPAIETTPECIFITKENTDNNLSNEVSMVDMELLPLPVNLSNLKPVHCQDLVSSVIQKEAVILPDKVDAAPVKTLPLTHLNIDVPFNNPVMAPEVTCPIKDLTNPIMVRDRVVNVSLNLTLSYPSNTLVVFNMNVTMQDLFIASLTNFLKWTTIIKCEQSDKPVIVYAEELGEPPP